MSQQRHPLKGQMNEGQAQSMSVEPVLSPGRQVFIIAFFFNIQSRSPEQQYPVWWPLSLLFLLFFAVLKIFTSCSFHFSFLTCYVNMHSVNLALNKIPWTRCAPCILCIIGSVENCLLWVGWQGQSFIPWARSNWLSEIKKGIGTATAWRQRSRQEMNGKKGKNLWGHSRREMGELEHSLLVDTQRRQRKKYERS